MGTLVPERLEEFMDILCIMQPVWLELGEHVYKLLDKMGVYWTSIDPLTIISQAASSALDGAQGKPSHPASHPSS